MDAVRLKDPENTNVLGLLMGGLLTSMLQDEARLAKARSLSGDVWMRAGPMWATLSFDGNGVEVISGKTESRRASVEGEMGTLVGVVTGKGMVGPFLAGKIKIGGNPFMLLKMLPLIMAE